MEILLVISTVVILGTFILIYYKLKNKNDGLLKRNEALEIITKATEERLQSLQGREGKLKKELETFQAETKQYEDRVMRLEADIEAKNGEAARLGEYLEKNRRIINEEKEAAISEALLEIEKRKMTQTHELVEYMDNERRIRLKEIDDWIISESADAQKLIDEILAELKELEDKRKTLTEAQAREREIEDQLAFHTIELQQNDLDDISYLEKILEQLNNRSLIAEVVYKAYIQKPLKEMLNRIIGKEKVTGIYKITNIKTKQCYIGQAVDVANRLTQHVKGTLGIQNIADQKIHHEMAKAGLNNWTFELLEQCKKDDLSGREKYYIAFYESNVYGYNRTAGG